MRFRHVFSVLGLAFAVFVGTQISTHEDGARRLAIAQETTAVARDAGEATIIRVARQATPAVVSVSAPRVGSGSGVVISTDGVILTNNHVVGAAPIVEIGFSDGRRVTGQVLGRDPTLDIAVVRVGENGLVAAPLGDSDQLQVGQTAIAIGNPIGLDRTVTTGIVSAVNRSPRGFELGGLIQTDAPINPGNSGGPLLDSQGRVIGINSAILRGTTGLGFAIPINLARNIAEQLITTGRITRPYLGVSTADIDLEAARSAGVDLNEGVIVRDVGAGTPADRAGIRLYDVITHIDGAPVQSTGELVRILRNNRPGNTVQVTVRSTNQRGIPGPPRVVQVRLAEAGVFER